MIRPRFGPTPGPTLATPAVAITIVGGGFSGACAAVQLVRRSSRPLAITLIEPRAELGRGLAYSATDPDHRLNATTMSHAMLPDEPLHFADWCTQQRIFESDPQARLPNGAAFVRRADYGRYLADTVRAHAHWPANGSRIVHHRGEAVAAQTQPGAQGALVETLTDSGAVLRSHMLVLTTGNALPKLQPPFDPALAEHPSVLANPLDSARLQRIPNNARVLVVGSGLTALDVASTLLHQGHSGGITVVSRRGLRPRPQAPEVLADPVPGVAPSAGPTPLVRLLAELPPFMVEAARQPSALGWSRALRARMAELQAQGAGWQAGFDELRDVVWRAWPLLPPAQQRRFLRRLRTWYDVHRFRSPPMNDRLVDEGVSQGRIAFRAARVRHVQALQGSHQLAVGLSDPGQHAVRSERFDAVINCSGLDPSGGVRAHPLLRKLQGQGWLQPDACGLGFAVDAHCRAIGADGQSQPWLRLFGPPTAGSFGDPLGAVFIAVQIYRALPDMLSTLARWPGYVD